MAIPLQLRPRLDAAEASRLARELFGVEGEAVPLASERDQNFRLDAARTGDASDGGRWVLKISNAGEPREVLHLQEAILARLAEAGGPFRFPRARATVDARPHAIVELEGREHAVRLLEWIDGTPLSSVRPHASGLLEEIGRLVGAVRCALDGFAHPAAARPLKWDLTRAAEEIEARLDRVPDAGRRDLVRRLLARSLERVAAREGNLRRGVLHNDTNDDNVLCGPVVDASPLPRRHVIGLIDVGDAIEGWIAGDVGIAIAYALLGKREIETVAATIAGACHGAFPLREAEVEVLLDLATLRLCTSVCVAAEQTAQEPDNAYLAVSEGRAWEALARIDTIHPRLASYRLRAACGLEPCPEGGRLREWLATRAGTFADVLDVRLGPETVHVHDLTVGSLEMGNGAVGSFDTTSATTRLSAIVAGHGKQVGLGRWNETRCLYGGELFAAPYDEAPRRRTVHVGVDLFRPAGDPIHAPLDGVVRFARDNAGHLDYGPTLILEHTPDDGPRFWTLWSHLSEESLAMSPVGRVVRAGERIATLGAPPVNGDWPPHLHLQLIADLLDRHGEFPGVADPAARGAWLSLSPDPGPMLGLGPETRGTAELDGPEILRRRRESLLPNLSVSYRRPLHIVRGFGQTLWDVDGQPYLDAVNNVPHVGHSHPRVVEAVNRQNELLNTNTRYLHELIVRYAERVLELLPEPLRVCAFVCTGSEANELAIRLARAHTGRRDIVALETGYHGNTSTLVDVSHYKHAGPGGAGAPDWVHVAALPDAYRGRWCGAGPEVARAYALDVGDRCADAEAHGGPAAFLAEPLVGCGGQIVPPPGYLAAAFEHARSHGAVCIADEVQIGLGRVGTHTWAFEAQGALPDILTLGKPIGNGFPLAAVVTTREIADSFATGMEYFNTFGGNPVACAAGLAVLDVMRDEGLQDSAREVGERLLAGLGELRRHSLVGDVRGAGLYVGVELVRDRETLDPAGAEASYVAERMRDHGILISTDGPDHNVLKIKPPLCFSESDADRLVETLDGVLAEDAVMTATR